MKIKVYIMPRRSGKTTKLINDFLQTEGSDSLFITFNKVTIENKIKERGIKDKKYLDNVITPLCFMNGTYRGRQLNTIFIDEWLLFNDEYKRNIYNIIRTDVIPTGIEHIIIATTSNKLYNRKDIELARILSSHWKGNNPDLLREDVIREIEDESVLYNFLGDSDCSIYNETVMLSINDESVNARNIYSLKEKFLTERCGFLYK